MGLLGLFSRSKPKIKIQSSKRDGYSGWVKCPECTELIHISELTQHWQCCPKCNYHYRLSAQQRVELLMDEASFVEKCTELQSGDPLEFVDLEPYSARLEKAKKNSGRDEAVMVGTGTICGRPVAFAALDFTFMGGSMGSVVGERLATLIEHACEHDLPLVIVSASGGARMQESALSLMQMAKTSAALAKLHEKGLPYISVLTNPTTGGVTASFASLGDVIIAEPKALICFAGPRVVAQTTGQKLPPGAQRSEFLLEKGMIDHIVQRSDLKKKIYLILDFLMDNARPYKGRPLNAVSETLEEMIAHVHS